MVHTLTLTVAQDLAWSLATSLMGCVSVFRAGRGYGVLPAAEFDGDASAIITEYDPWEIMDNPE